METLESFLVIIEDGYL